MAVAFDASWGGSGFGLASNASSNTFTAGNTLTVGSGSQRALVIMIGLASSVARTVSTVVWDSGGTNQSMQFIGRKQIADATDLNTEVWGLVAPTSGGKALAVTCSGSCSDIYVTGVSYTGADQTGSTTTFSNYASGGIASPTSVSTTITVTSASGNAVVSQWIMAGFNPTATGNTQIYVDTSGVASASCAERAAGASSVSCTITPSTGTSWSASGVNIAAAAAGGQVPFTPWPQLGPTLAQHHRPFRSYGYDHRARPWRRRRGLIVPERKIIVSGWRKAA